jgi:hypothetical protein
MAHSSWPSSDEALSFINYLLQDSPQWPQAHLTLTAIHPQGGQRAPSRHIPAQAETDIEKGVFDLLRANEQGWGAFVAIGWRRDDLGRWRRGRAEDVLALPALYADLDDPSRLQNLADFAPMPSAVIHSGHGLHAYWWLQTPLTDLKLAGQLLLAIGEKLGGDPMTPAQSLRLPGSWNTKYQARKPCLALSMTRERHAINAFRHLLTPHSHTSSAQSTSPTSPTSSTNLKSVNPDLSAAVLDVLIRQYGAFDRGSGWWGALCPAPHHHDEPGAHFSFNPSLGLGVCLGRHGRMLLKDLCHLLMIDPADYGGIYERKGHA